MQVDLVAFAALRTSGSGTAAFAGGHWTSLIHYQGPAHEFLAMAGLNGMRGYCVVVDFGEPKAAGLTRETVPHDSD